MCLGAKIKYDHCLGADFKLNFNHINDVGSFSLPPTTTTTTTTLPPQLTPNCQAQAHRCPSPLLRDVGPLNRG